MAHKISKSPYFFGVSGATIHIGIKNNLEDSNQVLQMKRFITSTEHVF